MILPAKAGPPGFTLLEMIISLFILALVLGMAMVSTRNVLADEELRSAVREFQLIAKTARKEALDKNRDQELVLLPKSWELRQWVEAPATEKSSQPLPKAKVIEYPLPEQIQWKVKRWGSSKWETPKDLTWIFTPAGLCAPHRFRFERKNSWVEFSFNPLTANPQEEDFYLP